MRNDDPSSNFSTIVLLRATLDGVFSDHRFFIRKTLSPCQIARYVLTQILLGERDLDRLKTATFEQLNRDRVHEHSAARGQRGAAGECLALGSEDLELPPADWGTFNE